MKPFKPPTLVRRTPSNETRPVTSNGEPAVKRRRISQEADDEDSPSTTAAVNLPKVQQQHKTFRQPPRIPLEPVSDLNSLSPSSPSDTSECFYNVLWRRFTTKKNKTWDGDGILRVRGTQAVLQDDSGKELGRGVCKSTLEVGSGLSIANREVEVESVIAREDYLSGRKFLDLPKKPSQPAKGNEDGKKLSNKAQTKHDHIAASQKERLVATVASSQAAKSKFKTPLLENHVQVARKDAPIPIPRHDPKAQDALVMKRPARAPKGKQIVDVVVDPLLTRALREHQRIGISFLYECVMRMKGSGEGAILADEMGLGKTLQTIALVWTLLKQNPIHGDPPVVKKAVIVCPVTLIENWRMEFRKWLGNERVGVYVAENSKQRLTDFTRGRAYSVMIIGYEMLTKVKAELLKCDDIGIVVADEGHRLKTQNNKAAGAIKELSTERRIILSGTPIQNDLAEFYTMADFVNPGILNKYSVFKREFEMPILKSQQPGASAEELEKGETRNAELAELTSTFILRRTAEILSKYLPPKTEYVVFCRPTSAQASIYRTIIGSPLFNAALGTASIQLELINILKKVCNSPSLLLERDEHGNENVKTDALSDVIPKKTLRDTVASGKLRVLDALLHRIHSTTDEKVVLVSNYTSTLDILARLVVSLGYKYLRLDGSTPPSKRQDLVNRFNRSPRSNSFIFLLSAKAGGTGLNLIGASRLILFDIDWNPATDLQAMARVHRDGQTRPCRIYRLLTQGALDEKIFQRQVTKTGLADSIVDGKAGVTSGFTREELRDLFSFHDEKGECQTHRLLGCECAGNGMPVRAPGDESVNETILEDAAQSEGESGDDEEEVFPVKLRPLNQIDRDAQEAELAGGSKVKAPAKMLSLMQYLHFQTAKRQEEAVVEEEQAGDAEGASVERGVMEDDVLRDLVSEEACSVGFVFAKTSV